jgi:murein DD-endopeptidase MepM/ murein hydrolase activator NlpD
MSVSKFHYNPKTCQYERAKLSWFDATVYGLGLMMTGFILFIALLALQSIFIKTEHEVALRKENQVLEKHHTLLVTQLASVESTLNQLQTKDQELSTQLFDTSNPDPKANDNSSPQKSNILFADAEAFQKVLESLKTKSSVLAKKSAGTNAYFGNHIQLSKEERELIQQLPSRLPLDNQFEAQFASGFGTRINPFHKGLYNHMGVDLVAPRGTIVFATGPGRVTAVKRSNLEAGYGNFIEIDHGHGFKSRYAHLEEIAVHQGQTVEKGFEIGTVGNSGGSIAPHIHYEVIREGENVDPVHFMIEGLTSAAYKSLMVRSKKQNQSLD